MTMFLHLLRRMKTEISVKVKGDEKQQIPSDRSWHSQTALVTPFDTTLTPACRGQAHGGVPSDYAQGRRDDRLKAGHQKKWGQREKPSPRNENGISLSGVGVFDVLAGAPLSVPGFGLGVGIGLQDADGLAQVVGARRSCAGFHVAGGANRGHI